ncbi:MAG: hypothetical protein J07HX64_02150 [halophilic archaeon J07HX64]|nr:MAG: hypothetical protein J07HX64_02150 [halophilic archaeon J07HX64]
MTGETRVDLAGDLQFAGVKYPEITGIISATCRTRPAGFST